MDVHTGVFSSFRGLGVGVFSMLEIREVNLTGEKERGGLYVRRS